MTFQQNHRSKQRAEFLRIKMPSTTIGTLRVIWWNTSLAPPVHSRKATEDDLNFVVDYVRFLRLNVGFDILALGEVSSADLRAILAGMNDPALHIYDPTSQTAALKFDTAVIYDSSKMVLENGLSLADRFLRTSLKIGEKLRFRVSLTGDPLFFIASHWPSRRTAPEDAPRRVELGMALRHRVLEIHEQHPDAFVILAGDYNDDPFSRSLTEHVGATRDRALVRRDPRFLYNPFWRRLGESHDHEGNENLVRFCGTHYYANGQSSRWFTFDQIIFSSAFLQNGSMRLVEEGCRIIASKDLCAKLISHAPVFDHLPVLGTIELRSEA